MAVPTFDWPTTSGASLDRSPRIRKVAFGDGYAQRSPDGLNGNPQRWSLPFPDLSPETMAAIDAFLTARGGAESFNWSPPGQYDPAGAAVVLRWVCEKWTIRPQDAHRWQIQAEFVQVPL